MRYYFAYGSNMWLAQMNSRCPGHSRIGLGVLSGYRWLINVHGYATLALAPNEDVHGVVHTLTERDERNLDAYEEVGSGLYQKQECTVRMAEREISCLVYIDPVSDEGAAEAVYIARINYGLRDAGLPESYVDKYIRRFVPAR
jgi:gamma-glutamylcyclotransferase